MPPLAGIRGVALKLLTLPSLARKKGVEFKLLTLPPIAEMGGVALKPIPVVFKLPIGRGARGTTESRSGSIPTSAVFVIISGVYAAIRSGVLALNGDMSIKVLAPVPEKGALKVALFIVSA